MEKYKTMVVKESYPDSKSPGEIVSTRILTAPTYEELFKTIDKEDHELMIYKVKSYNDEYNSRLYSISSSVYMVSLVGLFSSLRNGIDGNDFKSNLVRKIVETVLLATTATGLITAIGLVLEGIITIIKNKEVSLEGSKFVATNYPNEYDRINAPKSLKKLMKSKKKQESVLW
jgi:hypothetical protein